MEEVVFLDIVVYQIILQIVLILLNAFFAGSEIALLSLNTAKLRKLDEEHDKAASRMLSLIEQPSDFLSTIQIGITLAGFLGSAFASENFSVYIVNFIYYTCSWTALPLSVLNTIAMVAVTIILSYFTLVFGELVPKRIAMQKSYEFAKISSIIISFLSKIMKPMVWFLSFSVNIVLKMMHMNTNAEEENVSEEEIRLMVDLGGEKGTIDLEEKEWIEHVFEFNDTSVKEVMTHALDMVYIRLNDSNEAIMNTIMNSGLSRFPVIDEDMNDIIGVLYARDFLLNQALNQNKKLEELVKEAFFVPDSIHTDDLFSAMQKKKVHIAIVVDEYGETAGLITMEDLLEEIVGNIYDEYDTFEQENIIMIDEMNYRVQGDTAITELEKIGIYLPDDGDFDTLGGFIFSNLQEIPEDGSVFDLDYDRFYLHVDQIKDKRVVSCLITLKKES